MDTTYTRTRTRYEQTIDAYVEIGLLPTDDEIPVRWLARFDAYARRSDGGYVVASHRDGDVFVAALTESGVTISDARLSDDPLGLAGFVAVATAWLAAA